MMDFQTSHDPLVLAHRGWSAQYPENTLRAFRKALTAGADGLEFDVQLTADGTIVVIHDASVERTTDGLGLVADLMDETIRQFNAASNWPAAPFEAIPNLSDVLDTAYALHPRGLYNIEIKTYTSDWKELVDEVVKLTETHPLKQSLLFSSFHHEAAAYLKQQAPTATIGLLFEDDCPDAWQRALDVSAYSVHMDYQFVTPEFVQTCHSHGVQVAVWTVDEPADIARIARTGVDIVLSNRVDTALTMLRR
jgi:glycerophosphoryl diester phosphodiesterase